jgi:hypothetical protein
MLVGYEDTTQVFVVRRALQGFKKIETYSRYQITDNVINSA